MFARACAAQTFPALTGRVVDQAHLLTSAQVVDITSKSEALEAQTGRQFVVATVNSLEGYPIEDYAYRLGRAWKIGTAKGNDGVLLLVAPERTEGLDRDRLWRGRVPTDAMSGVITRGDPPAFQAEAARLRRRDRGRRRRHHQANEPAAPPKRRKMSRRPSKRSSSASIPEPARCQ